MIIVGIHAGLSQIATLFGYSAFPKMFGSLKVVLRKEGGRS